MAITAIYRNGVLVPDTPLALPEEAKVRIEQIDVMDGVSEASVGAGTPDLSGWGLGFVKYIAPDFDAPLAEFEHLAE